VPRRWARSAALRFAHPTIYNASHERHPMIPNAWSGFDFGLGEEIDALRDTVRGFAADEITPRAAEIDRSSIFPRDLWPRLGAPRWCGLACGGGRGGWGRGSRPLCVAREGVPRGPAGVGPSYGAPSTLCVNKTRRNGTAEQKRRYLSKLISGEHVGALAMS